MSDAWSVKLKDINPGFDPIPNGKYLFALLGANKNKYDPNGIDIKASILSEGESQGRILFPKYPDPSTKPWSLKALKRLEQSLGVDILPEEDADGMEGKIAFLNRAAKDGARFSGEIKERTYLNKDTGEPVHASDLQLFTVGPGV